jgi:hypothetical protein
MTLPNGVGEWATALSIASFLVFLLTSIVSLFIQGRAATISDKAATMAGTVVDKSKDHAELKEFLDTGAKLSDLTDLVKALTSVIEQISKAGPGLAGLIASILFMAVAAWAVSKPSDADTRKCSIGAGTPIVLSDGKLSGSVPVTCTVATKNQQ